jgi:hypothetical protein
LRNRDLSWKSFIVGVKKQLTRHPLQIYLFYAKVFPALHTICSSILYEVEITTDATCTVTTPRLKGGASGVKRGLYTFPSSAGSKAKLPYPMPLVKAWAMFMHAFKSLL